MEWRLMGKDRISECCVQVLSTEMSNADGVWIKRWAIGWGYRHAICLDPKNPLSVKIKTNDSPRGANVYDVNPVYPHQQTLIGST